MTFWARFSSPSPLSGQSKVRPNEPLYSHTRSAHTRPGSLYISAMCLRPGIRVNMCPSFAEGPHRYMMTSDQSQHSSVYANAWHLHQLREETRKMTLWAQRVQSLDCPASIRSSHGQFRIFSRSTNSVPVIQWILMTMCPPPVQKVVQ